MLIPERLSISRDEFSGCWQVSHTRGDGVRGGGWLNLWGFSVTTRDEKAAHEIGAMIRRLWHLDESNLMDTAEEMAGREFPALMVLLD